MKQFRTGVIILLPIILLSWLVVLPVQAAVYTPPLQNDPIFPDQRTASTAAAEWLVATHQNLDGGYSSFSAGADMAPSDVGGTVDALIALSSAGLPVTRPAPTHSHSPIDYLLANQEAMIAYAETDGASAGKLLLALVAAAQDPRDFGGHDYVATLNAHLAEDGRFGVDNAFGQSLAILGLTAALEPVPPAAISWLQSLQATGEGVAGSWDDGFGTVGNSDATAMAIMAQIAGGVPLAQDSVARALTFLQAAQTAGGGWEYGAGFGSNANSTALVIQALKAAGADFYSADSPYAKDGRSPLTVLLGWQSDSGAFPADVGAGPRDDFFTTVQAVPAVVGKAYPLRGRYLAAQQALGCLATLQDSATGGWEQFATAGVNAAGTARAIEAIAAMGADPTRFNGRDSLQALAALTPDFVAAGRGGAVGQIMQGVVAGTGQNAAVNDFAGQDLVLTMNSYLSPTGS